MNPKLTSAKTPTMNTILCSSCRRSEVRTEADVAVRGRLNGVPYRANLCNEHLDDLVHNLGLEVRSCRRIEATKPSAASLEAAYRHLCATVALDEAGLARLDAARKRWRAALFDAR